MNELMYVFAPSALIAAGMGGWGLKGWWTKRNSKASVIERLLKDAKDLEDISRQSDVAIEAANEANLAAVLKRLSAVS